MKIAITVSIVAVSVVFTAFTPSFAWAKEADYGFGFTTAKATYPDVATKNTLTGQYGQGFNVATPHYPPQALNPSYPNARNYGAGFRSPGLPYSWSGAGYRTYSFGWWL